MLNPEDSFGVPAAEICAPLWKPEPTLCESRIARDGKSAVGVFARTRLSASFKRMGSSVDPDALFLALLNGACFLAGAAAVFGYLAIARLLEVCR